MSDNSEQLYNIAWRNRDTGKSGRGTGSYTLEDARAAIERMNARAERSRGAVVDYWPVEATSEEAQ